MVVESKCDDILNIFKIFKTQLCIVKLSTISWPVWLIQDIV